MAIPKKTFLKTMNVFLKTNTFRSFSVFLRLIKESFNITKSFVADMKFISVLSPEHEIKHYQQINTTEIKIKG